VSRRDEVPPTIGLDVAAKWLGISYEGARRRARLGQLPGAFQIGARWRVSRRALLREIERLAGMTHTAPQAGSVSEAPRKAPAGPGVPAAALDGSDRRIRLTRSAPRFIAASEPIEGERSLVHKRARRET
jgi:hypothetical protein